MGSSTFVVSAPSPAAVTTPALFAAGLKKGCTTLDEAKRLYEMRDAFIQQLVLKARVSQSEIQQLDRTGRCIVASNHWHICTRDAREALLSDEHAHVRACANIAEEQQRSGALKC